MKTRGIRLSVSQVCAASALISSMHTHALELGVPYYGLSIKKGSIICESSRSFIDYERFGRYDKRYCAEAGFDVPLRVASAFNSPMPPHEWIIDGVSTDGNVRLFTAATSVTGFENQKSSISREKSSVGVSKGRVEGESVGGRTTGIKDDVSFEDVLACGAWEASGDKRLIGPPSNLFRGLTIWARRGELVKNSIGNQKFSRYEESSVLIYKLQDSIRVLGSKVKEFKLERIGPIISQSTTLEMSANILAELYSKKYGKRMSKATIGSNYYIEMDNKFVRIWEGDSGKNHSIIECGYVEK